VASCAEIHQAHKRPTPESGTEERCVVDAYRLAQHMEAANAGFTVGSLPTRAKLAKHAIVVTVLLQSVYIL